MSIQCIKLVAGINFKAGLVWGGLHLNSLRTFCKVVVLVELWFTMIDHYDTIQAFKGVHVSISP